MSLKVSYAENTEMGFFIGGLRGGDVVVHFASVGPGDTSPPQFKMTGFNKRTQKWEHWFSVGRPDHVPPSRASLVGVRHVRLG